MQGEECLTLRLAFLASCSASYSSRENGRLSAEYPWTLAKLCTDKGGCERAFLRLFKEEEVLTLP